MLRKTKASILTLATILAAGCAHSDYGSNARKNARWALLDQPNSQKMQQVPEPKILPQTYFEAARLLEKEGDFGAAIKQYRKAIAVNHNFVGAYHRLGVVLSSMGLHDQAIQSLSKATILAPDNVVVRNNYGFALMVSRRWQEAAAQFRRCTELQPQFTRAYVNLGMTLTKMDQFDEALATFRMVLPEPDAHYNLGLMYRSQGRYDDAAGSFRDALAANPAFQAANAELNEIASRLSPEVVQPQTVVTAIPLGRGGEKQPADPATMPPNPQSDATHEIPEVVGIEGPILIADSPDTKDAADHAEIAVPVGSPVGLIDEDPRYQTRTRDTLIALQPDEVDADRAVETDAAPPIETMPAISTTKPTPQSETAAEQDEEPCNDDDEDDDLATNAAAQPPIVQRIAEKQEAIAKPDAATPTEKVPTLPEVAQTEIANQTPIVGDECDLDDSPFPRPNMDPAYVIIGPTEIDPALEKMRLAKEREAKKREAREQERIARAIDEAVNLAKAKKTAAIKHPEIVAADMVAEEITPPAIAIEDASSPALIAEPVLFSLADEPTEGVFPLCELNDEAISSGAATPAINQPLPGRLDPINSEAIVAAFERHLRSFSSDDLCWDKIDWQAWDVIEPMQFAATETFATEKIAARPNPLQAMEAEEDAAFLRGEITPETAVLINETWTAAASSGETAKPAADPLAESDARDLHFVDRDEPLSDNVASIPTPTEPLNRRVAFHQLARRLDHIRSEISCWDEVLSDASRIAKTTDPMTSLTQTQEPAIPTLIPMEDIEAEMTEKMPPFERTNLDLFADRLPLVLDRACVDLTVIVPSSLPPMAEVMPNGSFAAPQVVSVRSTTAGLPILVREDQIEPSPASGYDSSLASSQSTSDFDWQATFATLDDVISIALNETACHDSTATNFASSADVGKSDTVEPQRTGRPTLASTIVKPADK